MSTGTIVRGDSGYALEYLGLAPHAITQNRPEQAERVIRLAMESLENNPFIRIDLIKALKVNNKTSEARAEFDQLRREKWSEVYHQKMKEELNEIGRASCRERV